MNARFAVLGPASVVANIILLPVDDVALAATLGAVPATDEAAIGDTYDAATGAFARPVSTPAELEAEFAAAVKYWDGIVQKRIDDAARDLGYGDPNNPGVSPILHAVSYADEPAVPRYQRDGQRLRAWRSLTWAASAGILNDTKAGLRAPPESPEALNAELEAQAPAPVPEPLQ